MMMATPKALRSVLAFLRDVLLHRDRYLMEVVSSLVTFAAGVLASVSRDALEIRESMAGFRDMPCPEFWVCMAALPGTVAAIRAAARGPHEGRYAPLAVMGSFWILAAISITFSLDNWVLWMLLALTVGLAQGYAIARDMRDLRWGVAFMGAFFWVSLTLSLINSISWPWPIAVITYAGWALANLLSVRRLSVRA